MFSVYRMAVVSAALLVSFEALDHTCELTAQSSAQTSLTQASAGATLDVTGRVLDARTRQPIARALVFFSTRRVLTDHDGVFHFAGATSTSGSLRAAKPGYFADPAESAAQSVLSSAPTDLFLSPEAILSGRVTNASGDALSRVSVIASSLSYTETGQRWLPAGRTQTDSEGNFRFSVPAGDYALKLQPRGRPVAGAEVLLPLIVPADTSSAKQALHLTSGQELHLDLQPLTRKAYLVTMPFDGRGGYPALVAHTQTGAVLNLSPAAARGRDGELQFALPIGTYTLTASLGNEGAREEAQTTVTVTDHDQSIPSLRFVRAPTLPVVVEVDRSGTSDNTAAPTPQQLGITFTSTTGADETLDQIYSLSSRRNQAPAFLLQDGVYQMHGQSGGRWVITSATCGGVDLLTHTLSIQPGMGDTEIKVRVSSSTGSLSGTVTRSGVPAAASVYLVATTPSASPLNVTRSDAEGTFTWPYLAPGSYRAVALERRIAADFQNPDTLARFPDRVQSFTITPGDQHTLRLELVPATDLTP